MSLNEIQQIYELLVKIDEILSGVEAKVQGIEKDGTPALAKVNVEGHHTLATFQQLERVAIRYVALARRISGSESADKLISTLSRILIILRMLQMSITMMTTGPLGVALGIAGLGMTMTSMASMAEGY